jgi:hypothetical protein
VTEELTTVPRQPWEEQPPFGEKGEKGEKGAKGENGAPGVGVTLLYGYVTSGGAKINGSAGWTVEKLAEGRYKVNITAPFAAFSSPVASPATASVEGYVCEVNNVLAGSFEIRTVNAKTGALAGSDFVFHCTGG